MSRVEWVCRKCGFRSDLWSTYYWRCPVCGSPLYIEYEYRFEKEERRDLRRFSGMLPFTPEKSRGEGFTRLVEEKINENRVLFKLEYLNPSGSFKDRGSSLAIYYAYKMGFREVVEDTSGNTGISVALYSKLYGLRARIYMPRTAPEGKKKLVKSLGAEIIEAPTRADASEAVLRDLSSDRFYVAHTWNYLYALGASTIAYEVYEEFGVPDYVISPIGSGGLLLGLYLGFENLRRLGLASKTPTLIGVQGYSAQPVYEKMYGRREAGESSDLADGIMVSNPPRINDIIEAIKSSGGRVVLVGNREISEATRELYEMGFIVEPTSAAAYAVYKKIQGGTKRSSVLIPLTGSGLKLVSSLS